MKKIIIVLVILFVGIATYMLFVRPNSITEEITQTRFEQMLNDGEVKEVGVIDENKVVVILNEKGALKHERQLQPQYYFEIINYEGFKQDLIEGGYANLPLHKLSSPLPVDDRFRIKD